MPTDMSSAPTSVTVPPGLMDLIELIHLELVPSDELEIVLPEVSTAVPGQSVTLLDAEGVPFARYEPDQVIAGALLGAPAWLGGLTPRAFERLYAAPETCPPAAAVVIIDRPPEADLAERIRRLAPKDQVTFLVLSGPSRAPHGGGADLIRATERVAQQVPGSQVFAVPVSRAQVDQHPELLDAITTAHGATELLRFGGAGQTATATGGGVILFTGLSGSGKSTVAHAVAAALREVSERRVSLLDGDEVRHHLSSELGFSAKDRRTNVLRIGWVASEIAFHRGWAICSPIAPEEATRAAVRSMAVDRGADFVLVHISTSLAECERRDRKGLYARARLGEIPDFTGISSPYEPPTDPDLRIDTEKVGVTQARDLVMGLLRQRGLFRSDQRA